ncbi:hypothetical protein ANN_23659 [Periplaneta americana]|uniref:Reverse transcriptase domain-containing protein n=1 Tax=Periplaneta americana TaxID=6978 RepID=A0ABQ8SLQ1_PERAM|nr:hypothetical protein ANN_23659 [Periplaneta americana]
MFIRYSSGVGPSSVRAERGEPACQHRIQEFHPGYLSDWNIDRIFANSKAKIRLDKERKEFRLERGVRQGDPMSPKMFNSLLEEVFRKRKLNEGITIDGKKLSNIRFADDIVLLATSAKKLEAMIVELQNLSTEVGLQLNPQKTKVMTNNSKIPITIGSRQLDYVTEYIYLGQLMSFHNRRQDEIQRRIRNYGRDFGASVSF